MVRCTDEQALDPLLLRPLNVFRFHPAEGRIEIIFRVVGRGTAWLAERRPGDYLSLLGPLGRGFSSLEKYRRILLFAGGTGMPALFSLVEQETKTDSSLSSSVGKSIMGSSAGESTGSPMGNTMDGPNREFTLFYGARTKDELVFLDLWQAAGVTVHPATDDGSAGFHGTVTGAAARFLPGEFDFYCACGPRPMLRTVQEMMAKYGIPGELCLEEAMACGIGACLGCVCETVHGYRRVCSDGPVFPAEEVKFS
ncbi:MAG: dihydroorotate dehydrogenase electron transfer subunit [Firmicutes bacterium]|nr:dihydroorotate dehydrogenase electron transfer subunit [Bacillota bacterium]